MIRQTPFVLAAILSLALAILSYRFVLIGLSEAFPVMGAHIEGARVAFLLHVSAGPVALAVGALQFMPGVRARAPGVHRWVGRVYAAAILIAGLGALGMMATATRGLPVQLGFGLLAVFWVATTAIGVRCAMAGQIARHRPWMMRSYALTLAGLTLRLYLGPMIAAGIDYADAVVPLAWISWVPNLLVAEILIRRGAAREAVA